MKTWAELTDEEKAAHRLHCIETARPDLPRDEVERVVDLLDLAEYDWETRRQDEAFSGSFSGSMPSDMTMAIASVIALRQKKKG